MRQTYLLLFILVAMPFTWIARDARAQDVLYRCESADGISIQGKPCPKGVSQRKIAVQHPADAPVPSTPTTPAAPAQATATAAQPTARVVPVAPDSAMHGPNDPYPLWQCMRADGSTFDSRNGAEGKQWVVKQVNPDAAADGNATPVPANITARTNGTIVRPIEQTTVANDEPTPDPTPPPPGAAPGQWVADQCVRLEPRQACARFAARRDALRKQIYAAKPSERATYAPEEQDLTTMLFAACGL
jgi:hypothetical protein